MVPTRRRNVLGGGVIATRWLGEKEVERAFRVVSREWAQDHGLVNPGQYPSWAKYPDARDIPVGIRARAEWEKRKAKILAVEASNPKHMCLKCDEVHLTAKYPWHDEESRKEDMKLRAVANKMTVEEVERRLGFGQKTDKPEKTDNIGEKTDKAFCILHPEKEVEWSGQGRKPKWCSDAYRKAFNRAKED